MPRSFAARLVAWQGVHGRRDLPWQGTSDPYRIWLSEIMLQQTQVATALPYYLRFLDRFPDVAALAAAPLDPVLALWSGLGYYRRAHHLHAAACAVMERHDGVFPDAVDALAALPGVGRSTAAAVAVFAFGRRAAILDGNVKRVLARHRGVEGFPGKAAVAATLWRHAEALVPTRDIEAYTQGLMDLGATVCTRARPACERCPVAADCIARRDGRVAALPSPRPAKSLPQRALRVLLLTHAGTLLLERRPPVGIWAGLWSLPEMPLDEDVAAHCLARFGAEVTVQEPRAPIEHGFTHYRLTLHPQPVAVRRWRACAEAPGQAWLTLEDAIAAALPAPIRRLLREVAGAAGIGVRRGARAGPGKNVV